jgi:hypothetical protein
VAPEAPFAFVQFEFAFPLGPADGRYLRRAAPGAEPELIVALRTLGAPQRRLLRRRRPRGIDRAETEPVSTSRATLIRTRPFESAAQAEQWLAGVRRDGDRADAEVARAVRDLNLVIRAHRAVATDPYAGEVAADRALAVRVGYGSGDQVAEGRFAAAYALPRARPRARRAERLSPQEHLAAILGGRERLLAAEELVLRARADVDAGRPREAALQARIALECLLVELEGEDAGQASALHELEAERDALSDAGNAALVGDLKEDAQAGVAASVERMERALRRRRLTAPNSGADS